MLDILYEKKSIKLKSEISLDQRLLGGYIAKVLAKYLIMDQTILNIFCYQHIFAIKNMIILINFFLLLEHGNLFLYVKV